MQFYGPYRIYCWGFLYPDRAHWVGKEN